MSAYKQSWNEKWKKSHLFGSLIVKKKRTQKESASYKEKSKWSFPIIIRTQSLWYLWELNLNKAPSSRLFHIMNKNMKLVLCQKNSP